jgi:hypothetical protein
VYRAVIMTRRTLAGIPSLLVSIFCTALLAASGCATSDRGVEKDLKPADLDSLLQVGGKAHALIVWTSSRAGTPHLFTMKSDGTDTKQLTKGAHTDWYPRFSPDGKRVLFSRSADKGFVREADAGLDHAWNLYTVPAEGGEATKVVENGSWGSWISNDEILFLRGTKIMRAKLGGGEAEGEDGKPKKVLDLARHATFSGAVVRGPELARDGHAIAMTLGGARRQVGFWDIKDKGWTEVARGTDITWGPDSASLVWVNPTGKELGEILRAPLEDGAPPETIDPQELRVVDMSGKRSREAFPRLSGDGKWLVFAAGINGLENDVEDYELYLFELGSAVSPTRLTFHSANDRWPDIFAGEAPPATGAQPAEESAPAEKPAEEEADEPRPAAKPAAETQEEPAATDAEAAADEGGEPTSAAAGKGKSKGKPKAKTGKKKKR